MRSIVAFSLIAIALIIGCQNETEPQPLNPNGDSELALLMRQMFEEGELAKQAIIHGKKYKTILKHEKILTAEATDQDKVENERFENFAKEYLEAMAQMNDANHPNKMEAYSNLISSCVQCHEVVCPGPLVKINKLILEEETEL